MTVEGWSIIPAGGVMTSFEQYLTDLGVTGVPALEVAQAISTDGTVVIGSTGGFFSEGWIANLPGAGTCPGDANGDGSVTFEDLLALLAAWGPCVGCPADFDGNGAVDFQDLLALLAAWGPCP